MTVTCVYVHIKPEHTDEFIRVTTTNHFESIKEPGNLRFDFIRQADDPHRFMLYEAYVSEEAAAAHKSTAHYLKWRETVAGFMAEPRIGVKYNFIEPGGESEW